jgi:hypothetical protein
LTRQCNGRTTKDEKTNNRPRITLQKNLMIEQYKPHWKSGWTRVSTTRKLSFRLHSVARCTLLSVCGIYLCFCGGLHWVHLPKRKVTGVIFPKYRLKLRYSSMCKSYPILQPIVLSVLRFTNSDYPFGIFKLFLHWYLKTV